MGHIVFTFFFTIMGILCLNAAVVGFFARALSSVQRYVIGICAILLFYPSYSLSIIAAVIALPLLMLNLIRGRTAVMV
jgi:TRAP-type uncharacterized transport system fused permease subunit